MLAQSEFMELLSRIPGEALGAVLILSVILSFITILATIMSIVDYHKKTSLARMSKEMIEQLLAKGYTPQEIEPLVNGSNPWKKMRQLFACAQKPHELDRYRRPVPPVKSV
jgi:hypothetical protein